MRPYHRLVLSSLAAMMTLYGGAAQAAQIQAGKITFAETLTASMPDPQGAFTVIDGAGTATAISGFSSLDGVSPSSLTLKVHLKQISLTYNPLTGDFYSVQGKDPDFPYTTALFLNGLPVATSSNARFITFGNTNSNVIGARSFRESLDVLPVTNPFYDDFLKQTRGSGRLIVALDEYNPAQPTGVFDVTGTITAVVTPEPTSLLLLLGGMVVLLARRRRPHSVERSAALEA